MEVILLLRCVTIFSVLLIMVNPVPGFQYVLYFYSLLLIILVFMKGLCQGQFASWCLCCQLPAWWFLGCSGRIEFSY